MNENILGIVTANDNEPEDATEYSEKRWMEPKMEPDPRSWTRTDWPMICLEYTGADGWEPVVTYCPPGEYWDWVADELQGASYDWIINHHYNPADAWNEAVHEGYAPGHRIWAIYKAWGTESNTPEGHEYDIDYETEILWEDVPSWKKRRRYALRICGEVAAAGGWCECEHFLKGSSPLAKKWDRCEHCAAEEEKELLAHQADPLLDLRRQAEFSYSRDVGLNAGDRFAASSEEELRAAIATHNASFKQWLDTWGSYR